MPVTINGTTGIAGVDGSAGTPAVQGTDTNTGIYFPDADTVAVSVGGTDAFRATPGGNMSITGTMAMGSSFLRNRIINGDMRIDQRNAGASVTPTADGSYNIDRWQVSLSQASKFSIQRNAGGVTPPAGFSNYAGITSLSAYSVGASDYFMFNQVIEGFNTSDFSFGSASAASVTLSFWVRSSLTGTFGGALQNGSQTRSYAFTYTISSANTWEQKSVTISGDTTGTWLTDNGAGMIVRFGLGVGSNFSETAGSWVAAQKFSATGSTSVVGTNGATWYITGVQLEAGTVATPFERRQYGQELALCQRYYAAIVGGDAVGSFWSATAAFLSQKLPATMRTTPTISFPSGPYTNAIDQVGITGRTPTSLLVLGPTPDTLPFYGIGMSGSTIGNPARWTGATIQASAEL